MILKGRYCIIEQIGSGGEGHLYLARDMELGCLWAVKQIPISGKREAKLLRLLEHPYMPRMIDYLEKGEHCYLIMEFIRGKSLKQWLEEGRNFTDAEILDIALKTVSVLGYLHAQKPPVFYGDLKPANLMLTENGRLCLVDFGSAVFGYTSVQRVCSGTVGYASPEQMQGQVNCVTDVYTWGRTMYVLLGKKRLWRLLKKPQLAWLLWRCCMKNPKHRFQDVKAVERELCKIKKNLGKGGYTLSVSLATSLALIAAGAFLLMGEKKPDFWTALTEATAGYYEDSFQNESRRREIGREVREQLQEMLRVYTKKEEQAYLLQLLEANKTLLEEEIR